MRIYRLVEYANLQKNAISAIDMTLSFLYYISTGFGYMKTIQD